MNTNQAALCIFCGTETEERHATSIGVINIHAICLDDLEEVLTFTEEALEESVKT